MERITELNDFLWTASNALWNLRWQVMGFIAANPNASRKQLSDRFLSGSGLRDRDLTGFGSETQWERQRETFAEFSLMSIFAIYEGWLESFRETLNLSRSEINDLQFPYDPSKNSGYKRTLLRVQSDQSVAIKSIAYQSLLANSKYSLESIDDIYKVYRYFKEIRNTIMHNNRIANQRLIDSYADMQGLSSNYVHLNVKEFPAHIPVNLGDTIKVELRGVVAFMEFIQRLMTTLDAELSFSSSAESVFENTWRQRHPRHVIGQRTLSPNYEKREAVLKKLFQGMGFKLAEITPEVESFMKQRALIRLAP